MDWNDVRHFLALARSGSARGAGAALGVSHSTVARRVDALEERLATRLFDRTPDGYQLTVAGQDILPSAERIEKEVFAIECAVTGQDERLEGPVALTCCDHFVSGLLMPRLHAFSEASPDVHLHINVDTRSYDLSKREADVAIRILVRGDQPPEYLVGRIVAPMMLANYVAISHQASLDPDVPGSQPRWAGFDPTEVQTQLIAESSYPSVRRGTTFASLDLLIQAACAGFGTVMLPTYIGDREPRLRRLTHPDLRHIADLWLLSHPDLRENARFRATKQCIKQAFATHSDLFRGLQPHVLE
ncbi:MAG: DNA-binding transcriptional LysR family regulator [Myxococcota bacterium]|jgi:DNA-binding transcriptional LysR family regulator